MWFDSRPKATPEATLKQHSYASPNVEAPTLVPLLKTPLCFCAVRLVKISRFPQKSLHLIKDFVSAFGESRVTYQERGPEGDYELSVLFSDSRDALKATALLLKFPDCGKCDITPIEQDINTVQIVLPQSISKEELWYEVSKRGDIAWSKCERVAAKLVVTYLFFDTRCSRALLQSPLILNGLCLHVSEKTMPHTLACSSLSKGRLVCETVAKLGPKGSSAALPNACKPIPKEDEIPMRSPPILFAKAKKPSYVDMLASPPPTESDGSESGGSSVDDFPALTRRRESRMDFFGQLTPPLQQEMRTFSPAISPPTVAAAPAVGAPVPKPPPFATPPVPMTLERKSNTVDLNLISTGQEFRTTVMLRNIPNKVNLAALRTYLDETNQYTYDFLYLRLDFNNKCNVGYAFINFTHPKHIATLTRARRGKKWTQYNSIKIVDVSFANIQGRPALVDKFRDSPIMNMDPEYRPKLYYTSGELAGEEEEFP